jgi:hypothetical protein
MGITMDKVSVVAIKGTKTRMLAEENNFKMELEYGVDDNVSDE